MSISGLVAERFGSPYFGGTFLAPNQPGRDRDQANRIAQQVMGEDGRLQTQQTDQGVLFTVPARFDADLTRAFQDAGLRLDRQA